MFWLAIGAILTGLSMASTYSQAKSQSKALAEEGTIKAQQRSKRTQQIAGQQKASFLQSGISLTGEGTAQYLIDETYDIGLEDIDLIKKNYNRGISNVMGSARTKMISQLGQFALSAGIGGWGSGLNPGSQVSGSASVGGVVNPTLPKGMFAKGAF